MGEGSCLICGLVYFIPILDIITMLTIRGKIREQKGIQGSTINDCLTIICCHFCALVQEAQEVHGFPRAMAIDRQ
ncbi:hypothetical protein ACJMK2_014093 [Sinanodonta woodiana]|uniref:Uncharacterized protein n=1 Tax=Sinanodonta woodiana TaxID=1069815 RepID=A0ABD3UZK9_SINWO